MKSHLKRLAAPRTWPIKRKANTFIKRPNPAGAPLELAVPVSVALKDMLSLAATTKEVVRVLQTQEVLVDGKRVYDTAAPVSLMGCITLPALKASYRLTINTKNTLAFIPVQSAETSARPCKIRNKTVLSAKKIQINCRDGTNVVLDKNAYKLGDTILVNKGKVTKHLPIDKGKLVLLYKGTHVGELATIKEIESKEVVCETADGKTFETKRAYCFVIGDKKPEFSVKYKANKNETSKNETSKNETSKNETSKNKTSKNKTSKNKTSKNKTSKNKTSK